MRSPGKLLGKKKSTITNPSVREIRNVNLLLHSGQLKSNFKMGNYKAALSSCHTIIALDPHNADAYRIRGLVKYHQNDITGAGEDLRKSVSLLQTS